MSTSSDEPQGVLRATSPGAMFRLEIRDAHLTLVREGFGTLVAKLRAGAYSIRCWLGDEFVEKLALVRAGATEDIDFQEDAIRSAAPLAAGRRELEQAAYAFINQMTVRHGVSAIEDGAMLFLIGDGPRRDRGELGAQIWAGVSLVNYAGTSVLDFSEPVRFARDGASFAGGIMLRPGGYFLRWSGDAITPLGTMLPLWLAKGWTTVVYGRSAGETQAPTPSGLSIHMHRTAHYRFVAEDERRRATIAAELALISLRRQRPQIELRHLTELLHSKFENPMLGLLGAHLLLAESHLRHELVIEVLENLRRLLGPCPDVDALMIDASSRGIAIESPALVPFPPSIRRGLTAVHAAEWRTESDQLVGAARLASMSLLAEGPWTTLSLPDFKPRVLGNSPRRRLFHQAPVEEDFDNVLERQRSSMERDASSELIDFIQRRRYVPERLRAELLSWTGLGPSAAIRALRHR